jgi:hypothetical protein
MKDGGFRIDFFALVLDCFTFGIYSGYHNIQRIEGVRVCGDCGKSGRV